MTTKPPAAVSEFSPESLEKFAYGIVADVETQEPNDRNRLGYHVWAWLKEHKGTLRQAVLTSGSRTKLPLEKVYELVSSRLQEKGIPIS
ncbi:MAG: hypothetical protein WBD36_06705 [Bacteroidota bacterium]